MTIKQVNTANLEGILTRIWSGELEHKQETFFCDTACCVAGWDVALNHPVEYANRIIGGRLNPNPIEAIDNPFAWSMSNNNLNYSEAILMFDPVATKYLQQKTLEAFKEGKRLVISDQGVTLHNQVWERNHYDNGAVQLTTDSKEDRDALIEFLGDHDNTLVQVV